jgi:hypothetical protein
MNVAFGMDQEKSVVVCPAVQPAVQHMSVEVNFGLRHLVLRSKHFCDEPAPVDQLLHLLVELKVVKVP